MVLELSLLATLTAIAALVAVIWMAVNLREIRRRQDVQGLLARLREAREDGYFPD